MGKLKKNYISITSNNSSVLPASCSFESSAGKKKKFKKNSFDLDFYFEPKKTLL